MLTLWNAFDDRFDDFVRAGMSQRSNSFAPAIDVVETENAYELRAELPGVKADDVDITLDGNTLVLRGERKSEHQERQGQGGKNNYQRIERRYGSFQRAFTIPDTVKTEAIEASLAEGVLTLRLPKQELAQPRKIKVGGASLSEKAKKIFSKTTESSDQQAHS